MEKEIKEILLILTHHHSQGQSHQGGGRSSLSASISHGGTSTSHDDHYETQTTHTSESTVNEETDEEMEGSDRLEEEVVGSSGKDVATSAGRYGKEMVAELLMQNQMLDRWVAVYVKWKRTQAPELGVPEADNFQCLYALEASNATAASIYPRGAPISGQ